MELVSLVVVIRSLLFSTWNRSIRFVISFFSYIHLHYNIISCFFCQISLTMCTVDSAGVSCGISTISPYSLKSMNFLFVSFPLWNCHSQMTGNNVDVLLKCSFCSRNYKQLKKIFKVKLQMISPGNLHFTENVFVRNYVISGLLFRKFCITDEWIRSAGFLIKDTIVILLLGVASFLSLNLQNISMIKEYCSVTP